MDCNTTETSSECCRDSSSPDAIEPIHPSSSKIPTVAQTILETESRHVENLRKTLGLLDLLLETTTSTGRDFNLNDLSYIRHETAAPGHAKCKFLLAREHQISPIIIWLIAIIQHKVYIAADVLNIHLLTNISQFRHHLPSLIITLRQFSCCRCCQSCIQGLAIKNYMENSWMMQGSQSLDMEQLILFIRHIFLWKPLV